MVNSNSAPTPRLTSPRSQSDHDKTFCSHYSRCTEGWAPRWALPRCQSSFDQKFDFVHLPRCSDVGWRCPAVNPTAQRHHGWHRLEVEPASKVLFSHDTVGRCCRCAWRSCPTSQTLLRSVASLHVFCSARAPHHGLLLGTLHQLQPPVPPRFTLLCLLAL